ncbi:MAG: hypothetical protein J5U17_08930 [Candidatus Methanoperedens sp.]|nr:hypothetical protein [Candidatus Methanoperedens sp.]MCE8427969.1 hypothetical protein [Candidatus Methanoperedens sp.]
MGFLGTKASSFSDLILIAQIAGFLILFLGFIYARKKNFLKHDKTAKIAVLIGGLSFVWMSYSLLFNFLALISMTFMGLLIVFHVIIGLLALFMGISLVLDEMNKTKASMKVTFVSWAITIFFGVILYIMYIA